MNGPSASCGSFMVDRVIEGSRGDVSSISRSAVRNERFPLQIAAKRWNWSCPSLLTSPRGRDEYATETGKLMIEGERIKKAPNTNDLDMKLQNGDSR